MSQPTTPAPSSTPSRFVWIVTVEDSDDTIVDGVFATRELAKTHIADLIGEDAKDVPFRDARLSTELEEGGVCYCASLFEVQA